MQALLQMKQSVEEEEQSQHPLQAHAPRVKAAQNQVKQAEMHQVTAAEAEADMV